MSRCSADFWSAGLCLNPLCLLGCVEDRAERRHQERMADKTTKIAANLTRERDAAEIDKLRAQIAELEKKR